MKTPAKNRSVRHGDHPKVRRTRRSGLKGSGESPNATERFRAAIEASVDCIITIDANSTILEFNAAAERTFGYARDQVIGKPLTETIIPPSLRAAHQRGIAALLNGRTSRLLGRRVEMPAMRADSSEFLVELTITQVTGQSPPLFTAYLRDITERKWAEKELSNSLELLRKITEGTTDAVFAKDRQGRYLLFNTAAARFVGKSSEEVIGLDDTALFLAETAAIIMERDRSVMESGETRTDEDVSTTAEGVFRTYLTTKGPLRDSSGAINGVFGIARDITERKRADEKLRESEARFRELAENIDEVFWVWTPNLGGARLLYVSPAYATIWGRSCESLYASPQSWQEALHPEDKGGVLAAIAALDLESMGELTYRIVRPDRSIRWISDRIFPVRDERGVVVRFAGIARDITESKITEIALECAEEQYRSIFNNAVNGIFRTSPGGKLLVTNPAAARIFGFASPEEAIEARWDIANQGYVDPRRREELKRLLQEHGAVIGFEFEAYRKDGSRVWISENTRAVRSPSGEILYFEGIFEDVTDRKRAEEELKREKEVLAKIVNNIPVMIGFVGTDGNVSLVNPEWERSIGWTLEELREQNVDIFAEAYPDPSYRQRVLDFVAASTGEWADLKIKVRDGHVIDAACAVVHLSDGTKVAIAQDITERKRAEQALRETEQRFRELAENVNEVFWLSDDQNARMHYISPAYEKVWGRSCESLYAAPKSWMDAVHPEDKEQVLAYVAKRSLNEAYDNTYRIVRPDGSIRWIHDRGFPVRDESGVAVRFAGIAEDVTSQKQAEEALRESEQQMRLFMEATADCLWKWDLITGKVVRSVGFHRLFGYATEEVDSSITWWEERLHPDDRARVLSTFQDTIASGGNACSYEYRFRRKNGTVAVIQDHACIVRDARGKPLCALGAMTDITERRQAEDRLRRSEEKFKTLFAIAPVGIAFLDSRLNIVDCNPALERMSRLSREDLLGQAWRRRTFLNADGSPRLPGERVSERAVKEKLPVNSLETGAVMESGDIVWAEVNVAPLALPDARAVVIMQDITERKRTEQARERGLSLMLATLESTADGILVVNTKGKIVTFNRLFARMWRLPDEVLESKEDARALECVLDQLIEPEKFLEQVNYLYHHPEVESFDQLVFKDGRVFERYSRPQLIGGKVAGRVWSFRDITERNQGREALQKANRQLQSLSRRLFQVQEQEKRHLARELHDEIGQTLTAVKINLTSLGSANGDNSLRLEETIALLDNLLRQVRQISLDLHPSLLDDLGLAAALRSLLDQQARRAGLRAQFSAAQVADNIDGPIQTTAFRIAQEAITNVLRHAQASLIKVQLRIEADRLRIEVADDGAGFDVAEVKQRSHREAGFGLMGMKERAALVGGEVEVTSARGTGTRVEISLPLNENGSAP